MTPLEFSSQFRYLPQRLMFCFAVFAALLLMAPAGVIAEPSTNIWVDAGADGGNGVDIKLPSFAPVVEKLGKAVVNISIEGKEGGGPDLPKTPFGMPRNRPQMPRSPFEEFLIPPSPDMQRSRPFRSLGSGFVIHPDGYIVTNNHVVERATKIHVTFRDDRTSYKAKVIGTDPKTDIALLKVDAGHKLDSVALGNSDKIVPGDWVIAIGNPFSFGHTATVGIVSAKSRRVGTGPFDDFIQTDASINPGNSGGPLFDANGAVVGMNTAIFSTGGGPFSSAGFNIGIGFAIPINMVKDIISELYKSGKVTRGWLGVLIQPVEPDMAEALKLEKAEGALVADVMEKSPAAKAGLERGDVIVSFDGRKVEANDQLPLLVAKTPIGKDVEVGIIRKGKKDSRKVKVQELKDEESAQSEDEPEDNKLGLSVQDLTPEIARSLGLDVERGAVVSNVVPGSEADSKGLQRGDVIMEADSQTVETAADFRKIVKSVPGNKPLLLLVNRNDSTFYKTLKAD